VIAAKAVCLKEAMAPEFKTYAANVVTNAQAMAKALLAEGFDLVTGGTDNHLMLADLRPMNISGKELQERCDANHITLNKNAIPGDPAKPSVTSGVRIGTAAVTTRGLGAEEMEKIAHCIALTAKDFEGTADEVKATVAEICKKFPMYV
jgi:glycine hydroxymethyltransferase